MKNHTIQRKAGLTLTLVLLAIFSFSQKQLLNKTYPKLTFPTLLQSPLANATAKNFDNKIVVLEFWATWCSPCLANVPHINEIQNQFIADTSIIFISITDQKKDIISTFLSKRNLKGWIACDTQKDMHEAYGVSGIPHTFIINTQGIVVYDGRPEQLSTEMLNKIKAGTYMPEQPNSKPEAASLFGAWGGGDDPIYTANFKKREDGLIPYQHIIRPTVMPESGGNAWIDMGSGGIGITFINASVAKILASLSDLKSGARVENHTTQKNEEHWDIIFSRKNGYTMEKAKQTLVTSLKEVFVFNSKDTVIEKEVEQATVNQLTEKMKRKEAIDKDDPASKSYVALENLLHMYEEKSGILVELNPNATNIYIDIYGEMRKLFTMEAPDLKNWLISKGVSFTNGKQLITMLWMY